MTGPIAEHIRGLSRRARTYKINGVKVREPNSDTRAETLEAATGRLSVRAARAELVQHIRREGVRGTPLRRLCLRLAHGERVNTAKVATTLVSDTGLYAWIAPAAERLLIHGQPPTDDERRFLRRLQRREATIDELREWLAAQPVSVEDRQI